MIQDGENTDEVEQRRQGERQSASRYPLVLGSRIARTEELEQQLAVSLASSPTLHASEESFITDWADS